jgi:hypothetical protein
MYVCLQLYVQLRIGSIPQTAFQCYVVTSIQHSGGIRDPNAFPFHALPAFPWIISNAVAMLNSKSSVGIVSPLRASPLIYSGTSAARQPYVVRAHCWPAVVRAVVPGEAR